MKDQKQHTAAVSRERPILLGFVVQRKGLDGRIGISIRWGRILSALVVLSVIGYLAAAGALFAYFKYNKDFGDVTYKGMLLLPIRLDEHRKEMGDYHVGKGLESLENGEYRDALRLLRLGVARSPSNLEGRKVLAEFYEFAIQRPDIAADLLIKGLDRGGLEDLDYLRQTYRTLLRNQLDDDVQAIADETLPQEPILSERNRIIAFGAASANFLRGNYDRADDYIINYNLTDSVEGILLSSQISWDRGNKVAAISKMEESLKTYPNSEGLLMQLSKYNREIGNIDDARRYAILRNVADPLSAIPRLQLLYIYNKEGDKAREDSETRSMIRQFRDDEEALQGIANFAADTGNIQLARRAYEEALENEFAIDAFALLLIESHLVNNDYEGALSFSEELLKEKPEWLTRRWAIFNSLRAVASFGLNRPDLGEIYLQDFIDDDSNQPKVYLAVARRFESVDRTQQARKVLVAAFQKTPNNQKVLTELIKTELALGNTENLNRLLSKLLQMRRPDMKLILSAYRKLGSDRFIFTPDRESLLLQLSAIIRESAQTAEAINTAS